MRNDLSDSQERFVIAREIAYNYLQIKDRNLASMPMEVKSFDFVLDNFIGFMIYPGHGLPFLLNNDVVNNLKKIVASKKLHDKVFFIPKQPMNELVRFTRMTDFGLTLDKDNNLNYRYSLPNKLFDYIHAGLPVLATNLVEVSNIVEKYKIGLITDSLNPDVLAAKMLEMMRDQNQLDTWKKNLLIASEELCWEREQQKFLRIFSDVIAT